MLEKRIRDLLFDARANARKQNLEAEFDFHRERSSLIRLGNSSVALSTFEELSRLDVVVQQGRKSGAYSLTSDILPLTRLADDKLLFNLAPFIVIEGATTIGRGTRIGPGCHIIRCVLGDDVIVSRA